MLKELLRAILSIIEVSIFSILLLPSPNSNDGAPREINAIVYIGIILFGIYLSVLRLKCKEYLMSFSRCLGLTIGVLIWAYFYWETL